MKNTVAGSRSREPDMLEVIYRLGIALRRVLILVDKRSAAARSAREALTEADALLVRNRPRTHR
jgi:hypothetical protein